jgi:hypothetical protein
MTGRLTSKARLIISANKDKRSSTCPRNFMGSHGVSKLSSTMRHGPQCARWCKIIFESRFDGSNPKCEPMMPTMSAQVLADSYEMKCRRSYFSITARWCSTAIAKVVFPIPPGPSMATRAGSQRRMSIRSLSSDSRPWNIFGEAGRREREPELGMQNEC